MTGTSKNLFFGPFVLAAVLFLSSPVQADIEALDGLAAPAEPTAIAAMEREMVQQFGWERRQAAAKPTAALVPVGEKRKFWAQVWSDGSSYLTSATCRAVGEHAYVFVEDEMWQKRVFQKDVEAVLEALDHRTPAFPDRGIYETIVDGFGDLPDVDGDSRIYILLLDIQEGDLDRNDGARIMGYFSGVNEFSDRQARFMGYRSNQTEMLYVDCDPSNASSPEIHGVIAHELQHAVHFNADPEEETWINEGCATFAELICGYGARAPDAFKDEANDSLIDWDDQMADYEQAGLFVDYLFEHWGGKATLRTLVTNTAHGERGITAALRDRGFSQGFSQVFADWVVANYLDDDGIADGQYAYANYELSGTDRFTDTRQHSTYPTTGAHAVSYTAANYLSFSGGEALEISFDGDNRSEFSVRTIEYKTGALPKVAEFPLDDLNSGSSTFVGYERIVLIPIVNQAAYSSASYTYAAKEEEIEDLATEEKFDTDPLPTSFPEVESATSTLSYDDGDHRFNLYWTSEGNGSGVRFTPPSSSAELLSAEFFISSIQYGRAFLVRIFADDGTGKPGRELISPLKVEATETGWFSVDLREWSIEIESDFHIMFQTTSTTLSTRYGSRMRTTSVPFFGAENRAPVSGRSWNLYTPSYSRRRYRPSEPVFERVGGYDYAVRAILAPSISTPLKGRIASLPEEYLLAQNYPNPFNASTTISYQIPSATHVTLSVYNLLGQEIRRLVDAQQSAGDNAVSWNGMDEDGYHVSSGVYLYRLQCGDRSFTRRMLVLE